jgi:hypothetical protein
LAASRSAAKLAVFTVSRMGCEGVTSIAQLGFMGCGDGPRRAIVAYPMPNTPVVLQVPRACVQCGRDGTVRLQQTIRGENVVLEWSCIACHAEWPVRRKEEVRTES